MFVEMPRGGGWVFELTARGRRVWDCEEGTIARAQLVLKLVSIGNIRTPGYMRERGTPGPVVRYAPSYVGVPAVRKLAMVTAEEKARPGYCREHGIGKLLL